jgi:hypothetical protein
MILILELFLEEEEDEDNETLLGEDDGETMDIDLGD